MFSALEGSASRSSRFNVGHPHVIPILRSKIDEDSDKILSSMSLQDIAEALQLLKDMYDYTQLDFFKERRFQRLDSSATSDLALGNNILLGGINTTGSQKKVGW